MTTIGEFGPGTIVGEEWLYIEGYQDRSYDAVAKSEGCKVMEVTAKQYLDFKKRFGRGDADGEAADETTKYDIKILEYHLKRNYFVKKVCAHCLN